MAEGDKERAERVDPQVTAAYRAMDAEEPPRALDEAILAASRRPARPWTQRWAVPLSLAAVVVLSVTVTLRIQHEAPELPSTATQPPAPAAEAAREEVPLKLKPESQIKSRGKAAETPAEKRPSEKTDAPRGAPKAFADAPASAAGPAASASRNDGARMERDQADVRRDLARSAESSGSGSALGQIEERTSRDAEAAARAPQAGALLAKRRADQPAPAAAPPPPAVAAAKPAPAPPPASAPAQAAKEPADTPEREFERIALLRAAGKHEEADKAFLEFRRRYPEFRISEDMLRRVERPQGTR